MPVSTQIQERCAELSPQWDRFRRRDMSADEFRDLSRELDGFFPQVLDGARALQGNLSEVLMAQDFQDLTGQIIRRVIALVQDVEQSLVDLVRLSGRAMLPESKAKPETASIEAEGPVVPGIDTDHEVIQGQDEVDDLLSSLGF